LKDSDKSDQVGGSLGGVYGNFKDSTDFCMLIFDQKFYASKKSEIEHSEDEFLIAKTFIPGKTGSMMCSDGWFGKELLECSFYGLKQNLLKRVRKTDYDDCLNCDKCELKAECKAPVLPDGGRYNVMIVGEAPGRDEDEEGAGFVGKSGRQLWHELQKYDIDRANMHVTNVVKCYPSKTKTPTKKQIELCSAFLGKEIEHVKPILILAFGNTSLKYFLGEETGIMQKSGTTEWSDKFSCWICWCIHPASMLYSPENRELFEKGIENFAERLAILRGEK
jgi:DNA polymerase